ncbi:MAG: DUF1460 domain-containing protein [Bacteroidia bacterium]|nr:DUF1460 domain-containing protein [Bacteroidia bacterium]
MQMFFRWLRWWGMLALLPAQGLAQVYCTAPNRALADSCLAEFAAAGLAQMPPGEAAIRVGTYFLGTPYIAHTLELPGEEQLVVRLDGLDCTTFLENVVAFVRCGQRRQWTYEAYLAALAEVRYRGGRPGPYPSRLHYFSDWIADNQAKGLLRDMTQALGGTPVQKRIDFMSTHPGSYRQLTETPAWTDSVRQVEQALSARTRYVIPKDQIAAREAGIQPGDLIAIATSIGGLDVQHVGMAYRKGGRIHLLHASSLTNEVEISAQPLHDYLAASKSASGIMVCRLLAP